MSSFLVKEGHTVQCAVRNIKSLPQELKQTLSGCTIIETGDMGECKEWSRLMDGVEVVIHLAGKSRVVEERAPGALAEYRRVNVEATKRVVQAATKSGVKRFIYVSSIGVNGSRTTDRPFSETDKPNPYYDHYALSKWEAEQVLHQVCDGTNMELVIVRPSLVYGPCVKGNMLRLLRLLDRGLPLPLANINNRRSLISVENLTDLLIKCIDNPKAAGQVFLAADGEDISTPGLLRLIGSAMDRPARLFPFPKSVLSMGSRLIGKRDIIDRLCGSLVVNTSKARQLLEWTPKVTIEDGLAQMASWYLSEYAKTTS